MTGDERGIAMTQLTRRQVLKAAGATAAAALMAPLPALRRVAARAATATWNHDPASPIGPPHWEDIGYPTCGSGMRQSPVDIRTHLVAASRGRPILLRYPVSDLTVVNTGHVVEVPVPAGVRTVMRLDGERYELVQFHVHAPSEHAVNGRLADAEVHFVHRNAEGAMAVVGVLFRRGPRPNELLDRILLAAPETADEEADIGEASPAELFEGLRRVRVSHRGRVRVGSFYGYDGSLTTPGCTEDVRWSVLASGGQVSSAAVAHLHEVISRFPGYDGYPNNNRPVQPLGGRVVRLRRARHHH
jgi:carbonic anhydrase